MAKRLTKAQQAEEREEQIRAALAWPDYPCPEPQTTEQMEMAANQLGPNEVVRAWTHNAYNRDVTRGCYNALHHSRHDDRPRSQTQGSPWFDTKEEAYRAMMWAVCRRMAIELVDLRREAPPATTPD